MTASEYEGGSQRFSKTEARNSKGLVALRALNLAESKIERIKESLGQGEEVNPFDYRLATWYFDYARRDIGHVAERKNRMELRRRMRQSMVKTAREMPDFRKALKLAKILG